jgi:hypothetical protein
MAKPKPYTLLTIVESESGAWEYEIRISHRTGVTYCTCKGWQWNKHCKHLDAYKADPAFVPGSVATAPAADLAANLKAGAFKAAKTPDPITAPGVLLAALAEIGIKSVSAMDAKRIAERVLATVGATIGDAARFGQPTAAPIVLNVGNVRRIILPD